MHYPNNRKVITANYKGYKYYLVNTYIRRKYKSNLFPLTAKGLRDATKFLKDYIFEKNIEIFERRKNKIKGLVVTKKYQNGELKFIYMSYNEKFSNCCLRVYFNGKPVKAISINKYGFAEAFEKTIAVYISYYGCRKTEAIKQRIENTRSSLLKKYRKICKEKGVKPNL